MTSDEVKAILLLLGYTEDSTYSGTEWLLDAPNSGNTNWVCWINNEYKCCKAYRPTYYTAETIHKFLKKL